MASQTSRPLAVTAPTSAPGGSIDNNTPPELLESLPDITKEALAWECEQRVEKSVLDSHFYKVSSDDRDAPPGSLLKVDKAVDTSKFALPPATALSRFVYQSERLDGSPVPTSAALIWPYSARSSPTGYQVVVWAHGTSGLRPNGAPSNMTNLWQHFLAPFQLAQQGYVVVAPDYAGLGVALTASAQPIVHEYLAHPAHANDVFHAFTAARQAFPSLGESFVVIGHSQGGGTAWSAAQRQVERPHNGYLGAVAIAPVTQPLAHPDPVIRSFLGFGMLAGVEANFPNFQLSDVLTTEGQQKYDLVRRLGATSVTSLTLIAGVQVFKPEWWLNPHFQQYQSMTENGGKPTKAPLLVIHGAGDKNLNISVTDEAVEKTLAQGSQLEYFRLPDVDHVPTLVASQRIWMDWIADRFAGREPARSGRQPDVQAAVPLANYQPKLNWYIALATAFYQTP